MVSSHNTHELGARGVIWPRLCATSNDGDVHAVDITPCQRCSTASSKRGARSLEIPSSGWPLSGSP